VVEGGPTKLECKVTGRPVPGVRWLKDRRPLGDDVSYETSCEEEELYTLCISATYAEHAGWYSCVARNDVGTAITEAKLTVESTSPPLSPPLSLHRHVTETRNSTQDYRLESLLLHQLIDRLID